MNYQKEITNQLKDLIIQNAESTKYKLTRYYEELYDILEEEFSKKIAFLNEKNKLLKDNIKKAINYFALDLNFAKADEFIKDLDLDFSDLYNMIRDKVVIDVLDYYNLNINDYK